MDLLRARNFPIPLISPERLDDIHNLIIPDNLDSPQSTLELIGDTCVIGWTFHRESTEIYFCRCQSGFWCAVSSAGLSSLASNMI